jgi:hypothetical protein
MPNHRGGIAVRDKKDDLRRREQRVLPALEKGISGGRPMGSRGDTVPHVVLEGPVDIEEVFRRLRPVFVKTDTGIVKATDAYIDRAKRSIIVDSLSIEAGESTRFMMMLEQLEEGLEIKLFPVPEVPKTDGIKLVLVETAKQLLETFPELEMGETNLIMYIGLDHSDQ